MVGWIQKLPLSRRIMKIRQRVGLIMMFLFLPINGPLWRMVLEIFGYSVKMDEVSFFVLFISLFLIGAILIFFPDLQQNRVRKAD